MHWLTSWIFTVLGARDEGGAWYGFWSGFGGAMPDVMILVALCGWWWHHTCHVSRCWRAGRHPVEGTAYRTCRRHHPARGKVTPEQVLDAHRRHA